jgi:excisionase family DNA binding protein
MNLSEAQSVVTSPVVKKRRKNPPRRKFADDGKSLTLSVWDSAKAVGIGREPLYQLIREGRVKVLRVGNRIRVPRAELEAFIEREAK